MSVLQFPQRLTGTIDIAPNLRYMVSTANLATITTAGYLNSANQISATPLSNSDIVFTLYSYDTNTKSGSFGIFTVSIAASNGQITLTQWIDTAVASNVVVNNAANQMTSAGSLSLFKANGTESANAVTANGQAGQITTSSLTTAGGASYSITWTDSFITATSSIVLTLAGGTNTTKNITFQVAPGAGSATLVIYNNTSATALNGTLIINYIIA